MLLALVMTLSLFPAEAVHAAGEGEETRYYVDSGGDGDPQELRYMTKAQIQTLKPEREGFAFSEVGLR